jgi:hypothetical protein
MPVNTIQTGQVNPALMGDPNYNLQMLNSQRQQQLAQALTQQGLAPIDYDHAGKISPLQGLNKMLAAYLGGDMANKANEGQANLMAQGQQMQLAQLGAGNTPQSAQLSPAAQAMVDNGKGVPTVANGAQLSPAITTNPSSGVSQRSGYQGTGAVAPTASNPYGLPPMLILKAQNGDPTAQKTVEALQAQMALTNEQKNSIDPLIGHSVVENLATQNMTPAQKLARALAGVSEGSTAADIFNGAIKKENYIAPAEIKQGNIALDSSNNPIFYNPKVADGVIPMFTKQNGITMPSGAQQLPGYARANAGIQGAEQGAKQANTILTHVESQNGSKITNWGGNLAGTVSSPTATVNSQTDIAKTNANDYGTLKSAATGSQDRLNALDNIEKLAKSGTQFGLGTTEGMEARASLNKYLTAAGMKPLGSDANANAQILGKYVSLLSQNNMRSLGGTGTDKQLETINKGLPSPDMMNSAMIDVIPKLKAIELATQAKANAADNWMNKNNNDSSKYGSDFENQWRNAYDQRIYQMQLMKPGERQQFLTSQPDADNLKSKITNALNNGYIK